MRNLLIAFILLIIAYSCTTDYDLQLEATSSRLVVDAKITNQDGPYLVRLTKSHSGSHNELILASSGDTVYNYHYPFDGTKAVQDAEVFIKDMNTQFTDTLIKCPTGLLKYHEATNNYHAWSIFEMADTSILMGFYKTQKIKGVAGHSYSLTIKWQGQEYHAESYMPPVPTLDSVKLKFTTGDFGKFDYNIPLIYFKEPQNERNYYLFITQAPYGVWPYSILSDEYLKEYVNGLDVCKGNSPDYWINAYPHANGSGGIDDYFIEMHSLTKEGYEYYKSLIQQFRTDGGSYSSSPASPPTNLDNGALGFFRASAVNRVDFKREDPPQSEWLP